ncbi:MAG: hypothetical protein GEU80_05095 [Dehalococcoidia bacterium]|nr:hypothetical protein [Dehalococcoidia bacterium]
MAVVTLTGHLGSMGNIAVQTATTLGYDLADRELLQQAAAALGWSEEDVAAFDERTHGFGGRLARMLQGFIERAGMASVDPMMSAGGLETMLGRTYQETAAPAMQPDDRQYIEVLKAVVATLAEKGDIVIVGRGGQALLADHEDVLHVRVVCRQEERIRRMAERDGMTQEDATARVRESDSQREAWHRKYFAIDYTEPYHYHLVVNSGRLSDDLAAQLIVSAVRQRAPLPG